MAQTTTRRLPHIIHTFYLHSYTLLLIIFNLSSLGQLVAFAALTTAWIPSLLTISLEASVFLNIWVVLSISPLLYRRQSQKQHHQDGTTEDPEAQTITAASSADYVNTVEGRKPRWTARPPLIRPLPLFLLEGVVFVGIIWGMLIVVVLDERADIAANFPWKYDFFDWVFVHSCAYALIVFISMCEWISGMAIGHGWLGLDHRRCS